MEIKYHDGIFHLSIYLSIQFHWISHTRVGRISMYCIYLPSRFQSYHGDPVWSTNTDSISLKLLRVYM